MANPTAQEIALEHYVRQQRIVRRTANRAQAIWQRLDPRDFDGSWRLAVAPGLQAALTAGQREAAGQSDDYVEAVIAADGARSRPEGLVRPGAFAGVAADGRPLESLFYESVIDTKWRINEGMSQADSLIGGLEKLLKAVATETADAGRTGTGASMTGNKTINGYIRVVNAPACARCIILAGKEFGWNAGFQRHPRCDCVHMPARLIARGRHHEGAFDPKAYFKNLSKAEQDRIFTQAGAQAMRDGASMSSVVNARRGMYTADSYGRRVSATNVGTTRRGGFYRLERRRAIDRGLVPKSGRGFRPKSPRLMPEEIYRLADDRDDAIRLLKRFGYLT